MGYILGVLLLSKFSAESISPTPNAATPWRGAAQVIAALARAGKIELKLCSLYCKSGLFLQPA